MKACGSISVSFDLCCNSEIVEVDLSGPKYTSFEVAFISEIFVNNNVLCVNLSDIKNRQNFFSNPIFLLHARKIIFANRRLYNFLAESKNLFSLKLSSMFLQTVAKNSRVDNAPSFNMAMWSGCAYLPEYTATKIRTWFSQLHIASNIYNSLT